MKPAEWHALLAFGLLTGALTLYDAGLAKKVVGVALIVIVVRNSDKLPGLAGRKAAPAAHTGGVIA